MDRIIDFYTNLFSIITLRDLLSFRFIILLILVIFSLYPLLHFLKFRLPEEVLKVYKIECLNFKMNKKESIEKVISTYKYLFKSSINMVLMTMLLLMSTSIFISKILNINLNISANIILIILMLFTHLSLFVLWIMINSLLIITKDLYLLYSDYPKFLMIKLILKNKGSNSKILIFTSYRVQIYVSYAFYVVKILFLSIFFTKTLFL